ncbi:MAG TPA: tetratricopeptide repeat protein [Gammaproteobacteria bacterium]|jgi:tetratricopeptide (TPR) repeat protein
MRAAGWLCCAALWLAPQAHAQLELRLELPRAELLLAPVSPPQLQKEGQALPGESLYVLDYLDLIGRQEFEAALEFLVERDSDYETLFTLLEAGDPLRIVQPRVVLGGLMSPTGGDLISATMLYLVGHAYFSLEQYLPAETAFRYALGPLPDYLRVHESLGLLYLATERYEEAREHLGRAAELGLHSPNLYAGLGYLNQQTQNYFSAASAFSSALVMETNESWQRGLLYALVQTRQYAAATSLVEQMLQSAPDDEVLWLYRSQTAMGSGQTGIALTSLETAIRLGDDSVANLQVAATLHMQQGSTARAVELLRDAFADGMDYQFLDQALTWLVQQDEWDYLRELLAAADRGRSSLTEAQQSRLLAREADLAVHDGDRQGAMAALLEAAELDPTNAEGLLMLGRMYLDDRDFNRAELLLQRAAAFDLYRDSASISLAQVAIDQENFTRALELLRGVVSRNPGRTDLARNIDSLENLVLLQSEN